MKLSLQLEPKDLEAYSAYVQGGPLGLIFQRAFPWLVIASVIAFVSVKLNVLQQPSRALFPVLIAGFFVFFMRRQRAAMRKKGTSLFAPMTLTISDSGLASEAEGRMSAADWAHVKGYLRTPEHVFLMLDGLTGHIIPTRCLSDGSQLQELLAELQAHTSELPAPSGGSSVVRLVALWLILVLIIALAWNFALVSRSR